MKNRHGLPLLVFVLVASLLIVAACEKERPAPKSPPKATAALTSQPTVPPPTPKPKLTTVALPTRAGAAAVTAARAAPPTPVPPTPEPLVVITPAAQPTAPGGGQYFIYKVAMGDTLGEIAEKFNVSPDDILVLNPVRNPDVLSVGQELKIPGEPPAEYSGVRTYEVRAGDTLSDIAVRFGVSAQELQELNNITDPNQLYAGQKLRIPAAPAPAATSQPRTYVVQPGDTLFSIALKHGVTMWALQVANNISDPNRIEVGQVLTIP